jgi:hypothetical protein
LDTMSEHLYGKVRNYEAFAETLKQIAPLPVEFAPLVNRDGECKFGEKIIIREDMSEIQTISALIHEIIHSKLHGADDENAVQKDRFTKEVESESIAYSVCNYFGMETGANSFGYILEWSSDNELPELKSSLNLIRKTASEMIAGIEEKFGEIVKERGITFSNTEEKPELPPAPEQSVVLPKKNDKTTAEHSLYEKFAGMFPKLISGEYSYMRLESKGFEPLSLEWISGGTISVMHTYEQNGDLCSDPMMTFRIDRTEKTMAADSFEQSIPPVYQYFDENGVGKSMGASGEPHTITTLQSRLNSFALQWFDNIYQQGYAPVRANIVLGEDNEVRITFDKDGSPVMPEKAEEKHSAVILPDTAVNISERDKYGYTNAGILPLLRGKAEEMFESDHTIYMLYKDGAEAMVFDKNEILSHDGIFGIETAEWTASAEYAAIIKAEYEAETSKEAVIFDEKPQEIPDKSSEKPTGKKHSPFENSGFIGGVAQKENRKFSLLDELEKNKAIVAQGKTSQKNQLERSE